MISSQYINYLFVVYAFFVPLSRSGISIFSAVLFILWLFSDNFKEKIDFLKSNLVVKYLLLFIAFSVLSLIWSDDITGGLDYIRKYWYYLPILVIATSVQKKYLEYAISSFLAAMLISEILSYGIFFELWTLPHGSVDFPTPFMHHIQYSMLLAFTSLLLLNRMFYVQSMSIKVFYFIYFLSVTANLFINAGRTGQVAFLFTILVVAILNMKNKILSVVGVLIFIFATFYTSYQLSPNFNQRVNIGISDIEKIIYKQDYCTSIGLRFGVWSTGAEIFSDNPILGTGVEKGLGVLNEYIGDDESMVCVLTMPSFHNNYIQYAVQLGIIGLILYLMIFYSLLKLKIEDRQYFNMMIIFVCVYSVSSLFATMFHSQFAEAFLALFIGIFIAKHRIGNEI